MTALTKTPIRNRYQGTCNVCGERVAKHAGVIFKVNGTWNVTHNACDQDEQAGEAELRKDNPRDRLTFKQKYGRCEDAPCCGCCGQANDYYSQPDHGFYDHY